MDQVFVLLAIDSNDETTIIRVFSNYDSAVSFKEKLVGSSEIRICYGVSDCDRLFINVYELWK